MVPRIATLALAALLSVRASGEAQEPAEVCGAALHLTTGQWAEYRVSGGPVKDRVTMRLAVVGAEREGTTTLYRHEMATQVGSDRMIIQTLVPGYPYSDGEIREVVVKAGSEPAMKMPAEMLAMMRGHLQENLGIEAARQCASVTAVEWQRVEVPAGSFRAMYFRVAGGHEAWISPEVPFGIVRARGDDGTEMVLVNRGADAKSSITEKPRELPGMGRRP